MSAVLTHNFSLIGREVVRCSGCVRGVLPPCQTLLSRCFQRAKEPNDA
jgi:hypothetical protein